MDSKNKALCVYYRNPPAGKAKLSYRQIAAKVRTKEGKHPSLGTVFTVVAEHALAMRRRGRQKRVDTTRKPNRKTTAKDDKVILKVFKKMRPPGHGVVARQIHSRLPTKLRARISERTIIPRLAEKGYTAQKKINKRDPGLTLMKRRLAFAKSHLQKTATHWKQSLHAVADLKDFTYYPRELRARFAQLRAPWTYMTQAEKWKPDFVRPKRWFPKKDWKKVKKQKVFGLTTSTGKILAVLVPSKWSSEAWAKILAKNVYPFLREAFPRCRAFQILTDGEKVLHGAIARKVMKEKRISPLPKWPPYSPDLNPQENVWKDSEKILRNVAGTQPGGVTNVSRLGKSKRTPTPSTISKKRFSKQSAHTMARATPTIILSPHYRYMMCLGRRC